MLHRTGKNWLLNLHFPLQAAWLRQSDSAGSLCHLLFSLPGPAPVARHSPMPVETHPEPPSLLAQDQQGASLCPHLMWGRFSGGFTVPAPVCLQPRGAEQEESTHDDVQPSQQHDHIQVQPQPTQTQASNKGPEVTNHRILKLPCSLSQVTIYI